MKTAGKVLLAGLGLGGLGLIIWKATQKPGPIIKRTLSVGITPSTAGTASPLSGQYANGARVIINAIPKSGYLFDHWSGDASGTSLSVTVTMAKNMNVVANFKASVIPPPPANLSLNTAVTPAGAGSVTKQPSQSLYALGDNVTITAQPASGYTWSSWDVDGTPLDALNPVLFQVRASHTVTAHFSSITQPPRFTNGDIISIGEDIYTVHGVSDRQYLLGTGRWPNDVLGSSWVSSDYIDRVASYVDHVIIIYYE